MPYALQKVEVWAGDIYNRTGMLARVLESLTNSGAQLEFMISRRVSDTTFRVFIAPLTSAKQKKAAAEVGLARANMSVLRIAGPDRAGLGAEISRAIADHGINMRGATAAAMKKQFVLYLAFGSDAELKHATKVVRKLLSKSKRY